MNDIQPLGTLATPVTLREFASQAGSRSDTGNAAVLGDRVEISELATLLSRLSDLPDDRARRVVEIRRQIAEGTYVTAEKLDLAADRLFAELAFDAGRTESERSE
jgi:anti-sigma28 factor (negative regulator of flagellin synthesis)